MKKILWDINEIGKALNWTAKSEFIIPIFPQEQLTSKQNNTIKNIF